MAKNKETKKEKNKIFFFKKLKNYVNKIPKIVGKK